MTPTTATSELSSGYRWVLAALIALPALAVAFHPLSNNDLPLHLAIGEFVWNSGIPSTDPFSFTAEGQPWVPHEWLAGILFFAVEAAASDVGLVLLAMALSALSVLAAVAIARRFELSTDQAIIWAIPLALLIAPRLILRPHLVAIPLALALWLVLIEGRRRPGWLWAAIPILAVWSNLHGSYLLGLGVVALELGLPSHPLPLKRRAVLLIGCGATVLAQLHLYAHQDLSAGFAHAFGLVSDPVFSAQIEEWKSPFASDIFPQSYSAPLVVLYTIAVTIGVATGRAKKIPVSYLIFVALTFVLFLRSHRFVALYGLAALPLLPVIPWSNLRLRVGIASALAVAAGVWFATAGVPLQRGTRLRPAGFGWNRAHLPIDLVDLLVAKGHQGGVLCEYHYGGVITWRSQGRLRPTMDSRNSVYGADLYLLHSKALQAENYRGQIPLGRTSNDPAQLAQIAELERALAYLDELLSTVEVVMIRDPQKNALRSGLYSRVASSPSWKWFAGVEGLAIVYVKNTEGD